MKLFKAKKILNNAGYICEKTLHGKSMSYIYFDMSDELNVNYYWEIDNLSDLFDDSVTFILNTKLLGKNCKNKMSDAVWDLLFDRCKLNTGIFEDILDENIEMSVEDHTWDNSRPIGDPSADWGGYVELSINMDMNEIIEKLLTLFVIGQIYCIEYIKDTTELYKKCKSIDDLKNKALVKQYVDIDTICKDYDITFDEIVEAIDVLKTFIEPLTIDIENWNGVKAENN